MRTVTWSHSGSVVRNFEELVDRYSRSDLASPRRSTVPLLAFWRDPERALDALSQWTGISFPDQVTLDFEHQVPVQRGSGKPSHTDLMILSDQAVVAIEAKHTEPRYEEVKDWLGSPATTNRTEVLSGWIDLINTGAGSELSVDRVLDLPYQLVHRAASACHPPATSRALIYQIFAPREEESGHYINDLTKLAGLIGNTRLEVYLVICRLQRKEPYRSLELKWARGERFLSEEVRIGLKGGDLIEAKIAGVPVRGLGSPMTDVEKAKRLFLGAGLAFPDVPRELAARLKERGNWLFSTRDLDTSPYNLRHYVSEVFEADLEDYAVIAHSGHGANSYAVQYFLVNGCLRMFLHIGWGGIYSDAQADTARIRQCFSLADQIVSALQTGKRLKPGDQVTIVASDFYGGYWLPPTTPPRHPQDVDWSHADPVELLSEAARWVAQLDDSAPTTK